MHSGMSSDGHASTGLRARKRAATQAALERAAIAQALEHGYENVTVDTICEAAMVSPRTFFNYFGTKEAVFLGAPPPMPTEAAIHAFVHADGTNVLGDLVELAVSALADSEPDRKLLSSRHTLIERTPELLNAEITRIAELEKNLEHMVLDRFRAQRREESLTPDLADEAHMVVALWSSVIRYAMHKLFSGGFTGTPRELLDQAMELIARITAASPSTSPTSRE